jgi:hypothetical protein
MLHTLLTLVGVLVIFGFLSFFFEFGELIVALAAICLVVYAVGMLMAPVETTQAIMGLINGTREILHNVKEGTKAPPL